MRDIFTDYAATPEEVRLRDEVLGGYPIIPEPLPEGYGESIRKPHYKGYYEDIVDFFVSLDPETRAIYHRVAEVAHEHPDQDEMSVSIFGFDPGEYVLWLAKGLHQTDPERKSAEASSFILDRVSDIETWVSVQQGSELSPMLYSVMESKDIPDAYFTGWDRHSYSGLHSRNVLDFNERSEKRIKIVRQFIDDPDSHPYLGQD